MATNNPEIIIFGPTGNVGSVVAATTAGKRHKVVLAMRDPTKPIPALESTPVDLLVRIKADLTDTASVSAAVKETGVKKAFFYYPPGNRDGLKNTIQALHDVGVEYVVFLSSFSVHGKTEEELRGIPPQEIIPYVHAAVELNLMETFRKNYCALRPGTFATNTLSWRKGIREGEVRLYKPELQFDYISSEDMGRAAASILMSPQDASQVVILTGPRQISQQQAVEKIAKALGKDVKITPIEFDEALEMAKQSGMPPPIANYLIPKMRDGVYADAAAAQIPEGSANVEKYTGRKGQEFDDWAKQNKNLFGHD